MEEENKQFDDIVDMPVQGSGSILAAGRKRQNKTVEEIASELNLSVTQIRTIELDQTEGLPEPTYVRGYIRSYAKLLGLAPEDVLQNYLNPNWQQSSNLNDLPKGIGSAEQTDSRQFFTLTKLLLTLVLAGGLIYLWYSGFFKEFGAAKNDAQSVITVAPDAEPQRTETDETVATSGEDASLDATTDAVENELLLTFSQTSWVDIRDEKDARLAYRSYTEGEELIVSSNGAMSVFIGNAEGVKVQYNGAAFDIKEFREGVYAKFVVGDK